MIGRSTTTRATWFAPEDDEPRIRRALGGRLHCVEGDLAGIFVRDSLTLLACDTRVAAALQDFLDGHSARAACRRSLIPPGELGTLIKKVLEAGGSDGTPPNAAGGTGPSAGNAGRAAPGRSSEKVLDRLVLNVSNDCNLRCAYCYAAGGSYGGKRRLMTPERALRALDVFLTAFDRVNTIQFFGGEPLLNLDAIQSVARQLEEQHEAGRLLQKPRLGVVTNGTLSPDAFLTLCRRYPMTVTVSVDGPREIHDRLRGEGTFDKVRAFTSRLAGEGVEFGIEGTYTAAHVEAGLRLVDLLEFYRREFEVAEVHVPPCTRPPGDGLAAQADDLEREYRAAVRRSLDPASRDGIATLAFARRLLDSVTRREAVGVYCAAGLDTLAVDVEGDIYPCFMFVGCLDLRLGNVVGTTGQEAFGDSVQRLLAGKSAAACEACWARPLCFGCAGADYVVNGDSFEKHACGRMRAMADEALRAVLALAGVDAARAGRLPKGSTPTEGRINRRKP